MCSKMRLAAGSTSAEEKPLVKLRFGASADDGVELLVAQEIM